ncbi:lateral flagellar biosynthetic protein LfiR [Aeromonas enteropelogenes]|uniref:lateral flagellar biosynthetic protein LfiR n=1 Tax=Aeromonas enteropelogenes TaxID=29489 RepID=UPI000F532EC4|nr:lateral flagellar biosynthetic protein LfiR [Aeromonas enteropelogenes]RQM62158.1 flagellar biosynthetic protein FliR [Aeromonas enteropelogenes]
MNSLLSLSAAELTAWLGQWWWPFIRIATAFWVMPFFGDGRVPPQVRLLLAFILSLLVAPMMHDLPVIDPFSAGAIVLTIEQLMFGLLFGLCVQMLFMILTMAGQILSMQMGLAMAVMNDPSNGDTAPIISQLMLIFCTLLFLGLNGHLVTLDILVQGLRSWPPGSSLDLLDIKGVVGLFGWSIGAALILTLPAVVAMLMVNLTFGVMNRTAPSLNIFSLGFPMTLLLGLLTMALSIGGVPARYLDLVTYVLEQLKALTPS